MADFMEELKDSFEKGAFCIRSVHSVVEIKLGKTEFTDRSFSNFAIVAELNDVMTIAQAKNRNVKI